MTPEPDAVAISPFVKNTCRICGTNEVSPFVAREMMFGTRDKFDYIECNECGCIQIAFYPNNISKYYPENYYSKNSSKFSGSPKNYYYRHVKRWMLHRILSTSAFLENFYFSREGTKKFFSLHDELNIYKKYAPKITSRILDVGCGDGRLVNDLRTIQYFNALGIDPFIESNIYKDGRMLVQKAWLADMPGEFDLISFNHVLEHMPDQVGVLRQTRSLLSSSGMAIVRIPIASSNAWRVYRENWVQLDPPRHFYLHTEKSLKKLAEMAGFQIREIIYDSTSLQFWGSELYIRDIPLIDPSSPATDGPSVFSKDQMDQFTREAQELNSIGQGDQLLAVLVPIR